MVMVVMMMMSKALHEKVHVVSVLLTIISVSVPFTSCEMKHINSQHYKIKEVLSTVLLKQFLVWYDLLHD